MFTWIFFGLFFIWNYLCAIFEGDTSKKTNKNYANFQIVVDFENIPASDVWYLVPDEIDCFNL